MGGIMNTVDAIEFLLAGASAIQVGTALFKDPLIPLQIINGINEYLEKFKMDSVEQLIGGLQM
jgi:dihydroorotate dehydrogenase (NAD+) catalytic subunit